MYDGASFMRNLHNFYKQERPMIVITDEHKQQYIPNNKMANSRSRNNHDSLFSELGE